MKLQVGKDLEIPEDELRMIASPSSGPGGQNVNRVSTRVTILFSVAESPSLSEAQRGRLLERLRGRISKDGVLRISSQRYRTQSANRRDALTRFLELVEAALAEEPERVETRVPRAQRRRRREAKRLRSRIKRLRSRPDPSD
jgi:ribosome-associated protein